MATGQQVPISAILQDQNTRPAQKPAAPFSLSCGSSTPQDRTFIHANINKLGSVEEKDRPGVKTSPLFCDANEDVRLEHWEPNASLTIDTNGGAEFFVLDGSFLEGEDELRKSSWLRVPINSRVHIKAGPTGTKVWIKTNHLTSL